MPPAELEAFVDGVVRQSDASMAGGSSERVEQAGASSTVDADCAVASVELLQHVAVSGQLENPAAEEIVRLA